MKVMQRSTLILALAAGLMLPAGMSLADEAPVKDEHAAHHVDATPAPATTPIDMQAMRTRMREIHQTADPEKRKALIEAQLKDMEAMMQDPNRNCPMAEGKPGMGMMSGKGSMDMGDKCGKGMMGGKGGMGMMSGKGGMDMGDKCGKGMMGGKGGMGMMSGKGGMDMGDKCGKGMMGGKGGMGMAGQDDMMAKRMEMMEKRMDMMQMMLQMRMQGMGGGMGMPSN